MTDGYGYGYATGIRVKGDVYYVWWYQTEEGEDRVETVDGEVLVFTSREECLAWASSEGRPQGAEEDPEYPILDCDVLQSWLDRKSTVLDHSLALDVLNMSIDVDKSLGGTWEPRRGHGDVVYRVLFAASVPWVFDLDSYVPRWSAHDVNLARQILGRCVGVLNAALSR